MATWPARSPIGSRSSGSPWRSDFEDGAELEEEIRVTVLHELGHYFGLDEDRLSELGYE